MKCGVAGKDRDAYHFPPAKDMVTFLTWVSVYFDQHECELMTIFILAGTICS